MVQRISAAAIKRGYDGFIDECSGGGEIVAFYPEQIEILEATVRKNPPSDRFANWFRNSKAVNSDGTPKVVYHGTKAVFNEFLRPKQKGIDRLGPGFYFTDHPRTIEVYSESGGTIIPVFLRIENPITDENKSMTKAQVEKFFNEITTHVFPNGYNATADQQQIKQNALNDLRDAYSVLNSSQHFFDSDEFMRGMLAAGIDGIITKYGTEGHHEYVVFDNRQIKSATNNTEYDPNTADIFKNPPSPDFEPLGSGSAAEAYRNKQLVEIIAKSKRGLYDVSRDIVIEARERLPARLKKYLPIIHRKRVDRTSAGTPEFIYEMPFYNKISSRTPEEPDSYTNYNRYGYDYPTEAEVKQIESVLNTVMREAYAAAGLPYVRDKAKFDGSYMDQDSLNCNPPFNLGWYAEGNRKVLVFRDPLFAWMPRDAVLALYGSKYPVDLSGKVKKPSLMLARYLKGCLL